MADYTESKTPGRNSYPVTSKETTNLFGRIEPILTPELLLSRYLKGVKNLDYDTHELKDEIKRAFNEVELMTNLNLTKVQHNDRFPFDRNLYQAFVFMKTEQRPILSIEKISIESSNGESIYNLPATWIESKFFHKGQINLIPILSIFGASGLKDGQASNAGLIFIQAVSNFQWLPAFFTVTYTTGVCNKDGHLPLVINELIGITAAIEILSNMQARNTTTSTSIAQDGISQSASTPGPQLYVKRIEDLELKKDKMLKKIKAIFYQKYFMSNI